MNPSVMRFLALVLSLIGVAGAQAAGPLRYVFNTPEALAGYAPERGSGFEPDFPVHAGEGGVTGEGAFFFSADVPAGNWRVTVHLVGAAGGSRITVKAELRRLML